MISVLKVHGAGASELELCRLSKQMCQLRLQDLDEGMTSCDQEASMYHAPDAESDDGNDEEKFDNDQMSLKNKVDALNHFLTECGKEPVMNLRRPLKSASDKTVKRHVQQASEVISSVLTVLAPDDAGELWSRILDAKLVESNLGSTLESNFVKAFVETYKNATHAATKRQVLSMMADMMSLEQLREHIPGLSRYHYTKAKQYKLLHGRGAEAPTHAPHLRNKIDLSKLDHFLDFVTSSHVIQDLPFGKRTLKLTSGEEIDIPNVIRVMMPSRLVQQYQQYCKENAYVPLAYSTLMKVLSQSCLASARKCLQGLDNYLAEGSRGFDELIAIVNQLKQFGLSSGTASCLADSLREGKRYLKSDFKVSHTRAP